MRRRCCQQVAILRLGLEPSARREHVAPILRHAFVYPHQVTLLRCSEVRLVQARWPTILSVPGVRKLVRQQVGLAKLVRVVSKTLFADTVVRRLPVLEALAPSDVAQGQEEVVLVIVVRCVVGVCLTHKIIDRG